MVDPTTAGRVGSWSDPEPVSPRAANPLASDPWSQASGPPPPPLPLVSLPTLLLPLPPIVPSPPPLVEPRPTTNHGSSCSASVEVDELPAALPSPDRPGLPALPGPSNAPAPPRSSESDVDASRSKPQGPRPVPRTSSEPLASIVPLPVPVPPLPPLPSISPVDPPPEVPPPEPPGPGTAPPGDQGS